MPKLRRLTGKEIVSVLQKLGFEIVRIRGSHYRLVMRNEQGKCAVTVPIHGNQTLSTKTIKSIYDNAGQCFDKDALHPYFYA